MINLNESHMAVFCLTVLRTSKLAQDVPKFVFEPMKKYLHDTFYPSMTQEDLNEINDFITRNKDVIQTSMMQGFMTSTEGGKNALEYIKGLLGLDDEKIEELKQLQFKAMKGDLKLDKKTIRELDEAIRKGMKE